MRKRRRTQAPKKSQGWMVTYTDLITLVLVFFILLFASSQVDSQRFKAIQESFRDRNIFEFFPSAIPFEHPTEQSIDLESSYKDKGQDKSKDETVDAGAKNDQDGDQLDHLIAEVNKFIWENDLEEIIVATRVEQGVVLVLPEQILFNSAQADILDSAIPFLNKVSELLKGLPNVVRVEGHTDILPINNYRYPSNWELSTARASSVIRYFVENHGIAENRFVAMGYSDTKPVAPNDTSENRAKNRRVEIIIMDIENE